MAEHKTVGAVVVGDTRYLLTEENFRSVMSVIERLAYKVEEPGKAPEARTNTPATAPAAKSEVKKA